MDGVIMHHLDKLEDAEEKIKEEVDKVINSINLDALIANAPQVMGSTQQQVFTKFLNTHLPQASAEGVRFAKQVKRKHDEDIKVGIDGIESKDESQPQSSES
jgi:hypothetical protein